MAIEGTINVYETLFEGAENVYRQSGEDLSVVICDNMATTPSGVPHLKTWCDRLIALHIGVVQIRCLSAESADNPHMQKCDTAGH